ncbi:hypothetical protein ElyMa_000022100 [Elysia marginata]|uniref:Uncharacterized protein n=1 Tax=Elysia marginata TaxID=1093978 RepID=A0AAV4EBH0_9GAST|nr:hypothetical protein ElyMa_000022100 [Elysia marginata]
MFRATCFEPRVSSPMFRARVSSPVYRATCFEPHVSSPMFRAPCFEPHVSSPMLCFCKSLPCYSDRRRLPLSRKRIMRFLNVCRKCRTLADVINKNAPIVNRKIVIRPNKQWYTDDIREAKKIQRSAEKKWRKTHLEVHRQAFVNAKKKHQQTDYGGQTDIHKEQN